MNLIEIISKATCVEENNIISKSRKREFIISRQIYAYFLRKSGYTLYQIGAKINKDHATAIYSINRIKELISVKDKQTIKIINQIETDIECGGCWYYTI